MYRKDWRGRRYGWLKIINWGDRPGWWVCKCVCGDVRVVIEEKLVEGKVVECVRCDHRRKMAQANYLLFKERRDG